MPRWSAFRHRMLVVLVGVLGSGLLMACGPSGGAAPGPDAVARTLVQALGAGDAVTVRQVVLAGVATEIVLASEQGMWARWTQHELGPQQDVTILTATVANDRASVTIRSQHARGDAEVQVTLVRADGAWKVETWRSYRR